MKKQKNNGISLIVLVITIIVMIILAGTVIISLSNNGIIDKAEEATNRTQEAQEKENLLLLAFDAMDNNGTVNFSELDRVISLSGEFEGTGGKYTSKKTGNTYEVGTNASITLTEQGGGTNTPTINEYGFYYDQPYESEGGYAVIYFREDNTVDIAYVLWLTYFETGTYSVNGNEVTVETPNMGTLIGIFQNEGKECYVDSMGTTYTIKESDNTIYYEGDYIYIYDENANGFRVYVTDKTKTEYGPILESINGIPVTSLEDTFSECTNLITAPSIPNSIIDMDWTFENCTSLITVPTISSSVTTMNGTFEDCTSLINVPNLSGCNQLTTINSIFYRCTSLISAPNIPNNVYDMGYAFSGCTSLKTYVGSTDVDGDFSGYLIPSGVTNMQGTFSYCSNLIKAPLIPSSVTNINQTFESCMALTGTVIININPEYYYNCFGNVDFETQNLTLAGSSTMLDDIGSTGTNYCAECNGKCNGGH